ncbi:MAG TPA: helix-turn-helix domain-containing protein [Solirubrobacteraceae bacterium]|nr:helix-turn-helix domain-containing protein [Solirubrobacteraceae bacterium]
MGQGPRRAFEAVADPVRLRIVRHLAARGAATVAELSRAAAVHPNTTRAHLAALEDADVVLREAEAPQGRGRPALRFRLHEDRPPPGADLHGLAEVLAAAVGRPRGRALARLRRLGGHWARRLPRTRGAGREASIALDVADVLARLGFRARLCPDRVELSACPCPLVAPDHPATVCALAHGAADGILAAAGLGVRSAAHDPVNRRCVLWLHADPHP